jgi:4'-phosphopantetheinyl transferase EntD
LTDLIIESGVFRQPILKLPFPSTLQLSFTHSESFGMAIIFPEAHPMGVDIEPVSKETMEAAGEIIAPGEWKRLSLLDTDRCNSYVMLWTIKEALSKVMRTGLMSSFLLYEIDMVERNGTIITCTFSHFPQYKSLSWISCNHVWSIVLPKNSKVDLTALHRFAGATGMSQHYTKNNPSFYDQQK